MADSSYFPRRHLYIRMGHRFCLALAWLSNDVRMRRRFTSFSARALTRLECLLFVQPVARKFVARRRAHNDGEGG